MFLDPEPRNARSRPQSPQTSPTLPAQPPSVPLRDQRIKREPLSERSRNHLHGRRKGDEPRDEPPLKPTVRLIRPSPSIASVQSEAQLVNDAKASIKEQAQKDPQRKPELSSEPSVAEQELGPRRVSDAQPPANEPHELDSPSSISLLPSATLQGKQTWHRRSVSSGNYSYSSTLKGSDTANVSTIHSDYSRSDRLSSGTTLRGTPTPYEKELGDRIESAEEAGPILQEPAYALHTLEEFPAEHHINTPVLHPSQSELQKDLPPRPASSRRQTWSSSSDSDHAFDKSVHHERSDRIPSVPLRTSSKRASSASFLNWVSSDLSINESPSSQLPADLQSDLESEASLSEPAPLASSPNFVAYSPNFTRPRSRSHPLRGEQSYESIQSRLQQNSIRPDTQHSLAQSSSWGSLRPSSSVDTLPSIHVPKKRYRHYRGSHSLDSQAVARDHGSESMEFDDFDPSPYPRQAFSHNLSTIASESERSGSRTASQHLSHFSLGSGVLTGDDTSSIPLSGTWSGRHRGSAGTFWPSSEMPRQTSIDRPEVEDGHEQGDMTLGLFRDQSAKPEPLFKGRPSDTPSNNKRFDGPLPPLPPDILLHDSGEHLDMVAELTSPNLKAKRSGYSLRHQRSNSTLGHSRQVSMISHPESERWSTGSSIFPLWAKHYYAGNAMLASVTNLSLASNSAPQTRDGPQNQPMQAGQPGQRSQRSLKGRLGPSADERGNDSPASNRFLPSIFRPRNRVSISVPTEMNRLKKPRPTDALLPPTEPEQRPDSEAIFNATQPKDTPDEILPSGQPKYGLLKDESEPSRVPLPRKYSKQKQWNDMTFPRPMTKDRYSDFGMTIPRLAPTKRSSAHIDAWRPPSFVESLDTLFKSSGHRQILFFLLGFFCPLFWMLGAVLPLPPRPSEQLDQEKNGAEQSEESLGTALEKHEAGDAAVRWREEKAWLQGRWWRMVNRIMSLVGLLVIGAVVAIAVVATR